MGAVVRMRAEIGRACELARGKPRHSIRPGVQCAAPRIAIDPKAAPMTTPPVPKPVLADPAADNQLIAERRAKLATIRQQGVAFPNDFKPAHHADELVRQYDPLPAAELEALGVKVSVAGRMMLKRVMGKAAFCTLQDGSMGPGVAASSSSSPRTVSAMRSTRLSSTGILATSSAARARCSRRAPASCRCVRARCAC